MDIISLFCSPSPFNAPNASLSQIHHSFSFKDPFEDPMMEPTPIKQQDHSLTHHLPSLISSKCQSRTFSTNENCLASGSFMEPEPYCQSAPADSDANLRTNLVDILDPVIDLVGSKRSSEDVLVDHGSDCFHSTKRQRISQEDQASDSVADITARFRPYQEK